jgi:hypothetical protein
MRSNDSMKKGCDALDLAAIWPSGAQLPGFPLPEIDAAEPRRTAGDE